MDLRKEAKGRPCMVRYPGICNHNPETTVLAHVRLAGVTGTGMKAPDILGAWCCSNCHDLADGRVKPTNLSRLDVVGGFYEGVLRTQAQLIKEGKIKW